MNKLRRQSVARALSLITQGRDILEMVLDEEITAFNNLPDSIQEGERGEEMCMYIDDIESFLDAFDNDFDLSYICIGK